MDHYINVWLHHFHMFWNSAFFWSHIWLFQTFCYLNAATILSPNQLLGSEPLFWRKKNGIVKLVVNSNHTIVPQAIVFNSNLLVKFKRVLKYAIQGWWEDHVTDFQVPWDLGQLESESFDTPPHLLCHNFFFFLVGFANRPRWGYKEYVWWLPAQENQNKALCCLGPYRKLLVSSGIRFSM